MEFSKSYNEPLKTISNIDFNVYPWSNPEYLIVTDEELAPHFKKLAQWKISKGIPSHIVTMKEIENAFNDSTPQLKLKKYLYSVYNKGNLKYVLLGGDDTVVPVQYCYGIVHTGSKSSQVEESRTIPADIYYACFGNQFDWDKNKNGIYGEYDDLIDASPSIYISRLPLSTVQDVNSYISKLIEYERNPRWNNNLLMTGTKLHGMNNDSTHSDAELLSDIIYSNAIKPYWNGILTKYFDTSADFTVEFEPSATALEKEGAGYVVASLGVDSGYVPYTSYSAKTSYMEKNPEIIQKFTNALQKGMEYVQSHTPEEIAEVIAPQFAETDLDTVTAIVKRYYDQDTWKSNLIFEKESFELLEDILEDSGELSERVSYEDLVTTKYAREAAEK